MLELFLWQIMESTESWGGACQVLRTKLQAALMREQVNLLEAVQHLQSENASLAAKVIWSFLSADGLSDASKSV